MKKSIQASPSVVTTPSVKEESAKWVFIPVMKDNIIKRTDSYVLLDVDGTASGIITTKFLRKKEDDECVFFSIPADYVITCRVREYQEGVGYQTIKEYQVKAIDLRPLVLAYNKVCKVKAR